MPNHKTARKRKRKMHTKHKSNKAGDLRGIKKWFSRKIKNARSRMNPRKRRSRRRRRTVRRPSSNKTVVIGSPVLTPRSRLGLPPKRYRTGNEIQTVYSGVKTLADLKRKTARQEAERISLPPPLARKLTH